MTTNVLSSAALSTSSSSTHGRRRLRSVGAVFAGLATIFAITTLTDVALHTTGVYPEPGADMSHGLYALAAAYRVAYGVLGCYVTARLAPARPFAHSIALGIIGTLISTAGAIAMWDAGPAWYPLAVIAMALPCAWAGGKLRLVQQSARQP